MGVAGSVAPPGLRHGEHACRGQSAVRPGEASQPLDQDPRDQGRRARHRGGDLCGRAGQRDALVLAREHYLAAAEAFLRGIERRIAVGLNPNVGSVASVFISRWDAAVMDTAPDALRDQLGIAIAKRTYASYRARLSSLRWQRVYNAGARPQRLLWASTGTKDPRASDVLYITALAAPFTVNTMPEGTLNALADHGDLGGTLPADGGDCEDVLARFARAGIDIDALAARLQDEGARSFVKSWNKLMAVMDRERGPLAKAS